MSSFRVEEKTAPSRIMAAAASLFSLTSSSGAGHGGSRRQQPVLEEEKEQHSSSTALSSHSLSTSPCPSGSSSSPSPHSSASPSKSSVSEEPYEGDAVDSSSKQLRQLQVAAADDDAPTAASGSEAVSQPATAFPPTASTSASSSLASSGFSSPATSSSSSSSYTVFPPGDRGSELLRPLFSGFESSWQQQQQRGSSLSLEPSTASPSSSSSSSPRTARRQLQHGLAVGGPAQSQPPPPPQSLRDVSQADVERAMGAVLLSQYGLQLMPALAGSPAQPLSLAQQSCADTLRAEGCPFCLLHRDVDDGSPSSLSPRYAVLTCSLLQCRHVAHLHCLLLALQQPAPASSLRLPALDSSHSTALCRLLAVPLPSASSASSARFHAALPTEPLSPRRFTVELCLAHQCANTQQARVAWPTLVPAHIDAGEQQQQSQLFLFLSFASASDDGSLSVDSPRPSSTTATASAPSSPALRSVSPPASVSSASLSSDALRFTALRGKLLFVCRDAASQESFEHLVHYDITQQAVAVAASASAASSAASSSASSFLSLSSSGRCLLKLVHAESGANRNVLTVGVHRARDGRGWAVAFVRYDIRPAAQPHLSSVQAYMQELTFPVQPVSPLLRQPVNGLPAFNPAAPAFVPSGLAALQTEMDGDGYAPLHSLSQSSSPFSFSKTRLPVSAPASSTASPVPSSRSIHYSAAVGSPSHLLASSPSSPHFQRSEQPQLPPPQPHLLMDPQQQQQRMLKFAAQSRAGAAAASSVSSLAAIQQPQLPQRVSPQTFSRGLMQQPRHFVPQPGRYAAAAAGGGAGGGSAGWDGSDDADAADDGRYGADDDDGDFDSGGRNAASASSLRADDSRFFGNLGIRREPLESNEQSPLFLPALPTFPASAPPGLAQVNLGPNPLVNLTVDAVRGSVLRLVKTHAGSRFVQQKLEMRDAAFFSLFYDEMAEHVPELMVDSFSHFAVEKLIACCSDDECLLLLQRLAPAIAVVACQKHGSFSVQALVDSLHTAAQVQTLVDSMKPDVLRIVTHASGHFVVLRMLQRFPFQSTRFIDEAVTANVGLVATDHHGLRVFKALLCVRRPLELTRLFKQVARMTMKLVENQYGNYALQAVLDVAPPGVRTNIKVKMEGKYMRLSKQKFSSNVVEKCLRQSSAHWRSIIIRELTAQPAVAELLRDRYGNYVLQTGLNVANAQQVADIMRAITPYLPSLRDNVRSKWKKMLRKAGAAVARGGGGAAADDREDGEPLSPDPRQQLGAADDDGGGDGDDGVLGYYAPAAGGGDVGSAFSLHSPHAGSAAFSYHALSSPTHAYSSQQQQHAGLSALGLAGGYGSGSAAGGGVSSVGAGAVSPSSSLFHSALGGFSSSSSLLGLSGAPLAVSAMAGGGGGGGGGGLGSFSSSSQPLTHQQEMRLF